MARGRSQPAHLKPLARKPEAFKLLRPDEEIVAALARIVAARAVEMMKAKRPACAGRKP